MIRAGLDGPSRRIVVQPSEQPTEAPAVEPAPAETPAVGVRFRQVMADVESRYQAARERDFARDTDQMTPEQCREVQQRLKQEREDREARRGRA